MSVGASLFLIATGAILRYAVKWHPGDIKLDTAGLILMIVGIIGLILSLMWMFWPGDRRRTPPAPPAPPRPPA
jgi:amino acid transporter